MTEKSGSPPHSGHVPCVQPTRSVLAMTASAERVRNGRIACSSTGSRPSASAWMGAAFGPVASYHERSAPGSALRIPAQRFDAAKVPVLEGLVRPHRRGRGPQQKPQVAPLNRQMFEAQDGRGRELRVQVVPVETDGRERDARLHAPLQLEQFDLQIDGRPEVRLFLFQSSEFGNFTRFRSSGRRYLRFGHGTILS